MTSHTQQKTFSHSRIKHHGKRNATILVVSMALVTLIVVMVVLAGHQGVSVGQQAPDFQITDLAGSSFRLYDANPRPVLIEFMATRCSHCVNEAPILSGLYAQYSTKVTFLSISIDTVYDTPQLLQAFANNHDMPWIWARDTSSVGTIFGATRTPTMIILDAGHIVKYRFEGETSSAILSNALSTVTG